MIKGAGAMRGRRPWRGAYGTVGLLVSLLVVACGGPGASGGTLPIKGGAGVALTRGGAALGVAAARGGALAARGINAGGRGVGRPPRLGGRGSGDGLPRT